jgi:hypothetical protein
MACDDQLASWRGNTVQVYQRCKQWGCNMGSGSQPYLYSASHVRDRRDCLEHLAELGGIEQSGIEHSMEMENHCRETQNFHCREMDCPCSSILLFHCIYFNTNIHSHKIPSLSLTMKLKM